MHQRRPVSRPSSEAKAEQADASQSQRVRRSHRHSPGQHLDDSDDATPAEVVLPRARAAHSRSAFMNSRSSWDQHPSGVSPGRPSRSGLMREELRRPVSQQGQTTRPPLAAPEQLRRPRSQGSIESSSQVTRSGVRRSQASSSSEQRPVSAGHIRRQQLASQGRRPHDANQGRRLADALSRRPHEATTRTPAGQNLGNDSEPSGHQEISPTEAQVGLRAPPEETPDVRISVGGPSLQLAVEGMDPILLPMHGMLSALDDENVHPLIAMARRIEMATQLVRLLEEQSLEERILRAVVEESTQEQLRAALEQSIAEQQSQSAVPPVKEGVLESLPHVVVTKEDLLDQTNSQCSICLEKYTPGARATRILCGHLFCTNCLTGWLSSANSCPVCRYELPTERADFEEGRKDRMKGRKAVLKEGDLMMMSGPALERLLSVLEISTEDCVEKADLLDLLRTNPDVQISLDRSGVSYVEADFAQLNLHAMCALMQRHGITLPPPRFHKDDQTMRAEVVRRFRAAGLMEPAGLPFSCGSREPESRPAPELQAKLAQAKLDLKTRATTFRSTRRTKSDTKTKIGRGEHMKVQGLRIDSAFGASEQALSSVEGHSSSSSSHFLTDLALGPPMEEDAEAEEILLSAEASSSNRPCSRGSNFPARSPNASRCWEPPKNRVRSMSEKTLRRACDSPHSSPVHAESRDHTRSMDSSDSSRAPTGHWFKRSPTLTPGQEVHKSAAAAPPAQKATMLGRPSKFVQRMRRSFKFGGV